MNTYENKPDWSVVKGEWLCQNHDGQWVSFVNKPEPCELNDMLRGLVKYWAADGGHAKSYGFDKVLGDWKDTLEKRPEYVEGQEKANFEIVDQFTVYGKDDKQVEILVIDTNVLPLKGLDKFQSLMEAKLGTPTITINVGKTKCAN